MEQISDYVEDMKKVAKINPGMLFSGPDATIATISKLGQEDYVYSFTTPSKLKQEDFAGDRSKLDKIEVFKFVYNYMCKLQRDDPDVKHVETNFINLVAYENDPTLSQYANLFLIVLEFIENDGDLEECNAALVIIEKFIDQAKKFADVREVQTVLVLTSDTLKSKALKCNKIKTAIKDILLNDISHFRYNYYIRGLLLKLYFRMTVMLAKEMGVCSRFEGMLTNKTLFSIKEALEFKHEKYRLPKNATVYMHDSTFARETMIDKVESRFQELLERTTLDKYDFTDTIIAGGAFTSHYYSSSDIDLFIVGDQQRAIRTFVNHFSNSEFYMSSKTLSVFIEDKKIQLVLRAYDSPISVLDSFDLGPACIFYDGKDIFMYEECMYSINTKNLVVNLRRRKAGYSGRLVKYYRMKSFDLVFIDDITKYECKFISEGKVNHFISIYDMILYKERKCYLMNNFRVLTGSVVNISHKVTQDDKPVPVYKYDDANTYKHIVVYNPEDDNDYYGTFDIKNCYCSEQYLSYKIDLLSDKRFNPATIYILMNAEQIIRFLDSGKLIIRIEITKEEMRKDYTKILSEKSLQKLKTSTFNIIDLHIGLDRYDSEFYRVDIPVGLNDIFNVYV